MRHAAQGWVAALHPCGRPRAIDCVQHALVSGHAPLMIGACEQQLQLSRGTLPLAASMFRICGPMASLTTAIYAAQVLGIPLGTPRLVTGGLIAIIMIAAGAGVPGEITFFAVYVPIFNSMGIPIEILALIVAVFAIPDMFNTNSGWFARNPLQTRARVVSGRKFPFRLGSGTLRV